MKLRITVLLCCRIEEENNELRERMTSLEEQRVNEEKALMSEVSTLRHKLCNAMGIIRTQEQELKKCENTIAKHLMPQDSIQREIIVTSTNLNSKLLRLSQNMATLRQSGPTPKRTIETLYTSDCSLGTILPTAPQKKHKIGTEGETLTCEEL